MLEKLFSDTLSRLLRGWSFKNVSVFEVETSFRQERTDHSMPAINVYLANTRQELKWKILAMLAWFSEREREKHRQLGH